MVTNFDIHLFNQKVMKWQTRNKVITSQNVHLSKTFENVQIKKKNL